jgi:hypothetical protein
MDYIAQKVKEKKYAKESLDKLIIPDDPKLVGVHMNKIYYEYLLNNKVVSDYDYHEIQKLQHLDASNPTINYNLLFCKMQLDSTVGDANTQKDVQNTIDGFYKTDIPKKYVDGLNTEWQFKIMDALDTVAGAEEQRQACINRIKSFYNFKEGNKQNAIKLAYAFAHAKDYKFAGDLLEPYLKDADTKVLYAYVAIASHVPEKFFSHKFSYALDEIKKADPNKYCKLFGDPYLSFQILDNPDVKKTYQEANCEQ